MRSEPGPGSPECRLAPAAEGTPADCSRARSIWTAATPALPGPESADFTRGPATGRNAAIRRTPPRSCGGGPGLARARGRFPTARCRRRTSRWPRVLARFPHSEADAAASGELFAVLPKNRSQTLIRRQIGPRGVGSEPHELEVGGEGDQLAADHPTGPVGCVDDAFVEVDGVGDGRERVDAPEAETGVEVVAHLEDAQRVALEMQPNLPAWLPAPAVSARVRRQPCPGVDTPPCQVLKECAVAGLSLPPVVIAGQVCPQEPEQPAAVGLDVDAEEGGVEQVLVEGDVVERSSDDLPEPRR